MSGPTNYYDVLGVKKNATEAEIRTAYIRESLKTHPDRNDAPDATVQFQSVADAYYVLSDKERRTAYDSEMAFKFDEPVNPITVFGEMFNDLMVPEVPNPSYFWQPIGTISGIMMGQVLADSSIRDMKGVSVYEAYCKLSHEKRQEILANLGKKFFTTAISN
ncbi:hypothetical protein HDU91_006416 [Kappamyces sp. JEL0680]|nr:hypothetical protein HDU91_006416 [Kappamyces sp. JEL0680]